MTGRVRTIAGLLALVWMCVIFFFSAQPKEESSAVSGAFSYRVVSSTGLLFHLNLDEEKLRRIAAAIESNVRKAAHMTEYAVLSVLFYVWLGKWQFAGFSLIKSAGRKRSISAVLLTVSYAVSDEIHQLLVPGRAGMVRDVIIDSTGAILGIFVFMGVKRCISFLWSRRKYKAVESL